MVEIENDSFSHLYSSTLFKRVYTINFDEFKVTVFKSGTMVYSVGRLEVRSGLEIEKNEVSS